MKKIKSHIEKLKIAGFGENHLHLLKIAGFGGNHLHFDENHWYLMKISLNPMKINLVKKIKRNIDQLKGLEQQKSIFASDENLSCNQFATNLQPFCIFFALKIKCN